MRVFSGGPPPPVIFVAIDSGTIKKVGKWPIPRGLYAEALEQIRREEPGAILMDIDFSSKGPDPEEDRRLIEAVRNTKNIVLAVQMVERPAQEGATVRSVSLPMPGLMGASPALGSIIFTVDPDGVVRRLPEPIDFIDEIYYPMGMVGARILNPGISFDHEDNALIAMSPGILRSLPEVSFQTVLEGGFKPGIFRDRIVILGANTPELHDYWLTPIGIVPGIYIQAAVVQTVLNRSWYLRSDKLATVAALVVVSLLIGQIMGRIEWRKGLLFLAVFLVLLLITAALFAYGGRMIPVVPLAAVALLQYPVHVAVQTRGAERKLALTREKTEAILKFSELKAAEDAGREDYLVPLILLRQVLDLRQVHLFRHDGNIDPAWKVETVFGEKPEMKDLLENVSDVMAGGEVLCLHEAGSSSAHVLIPMMTSRSRHGVLFVEGSWSILGDQENVRLLFSYATQASYFFETWELDQRIKSLYSNTIKAITRALDSRDYYTSAHSELSLEYVEKFGRACGLDRVQIESLHIGTLLHDIGKIGIPDGILNKKGKLDAKEWDVLKQHPVIGFEIIKDLPFPHDVKMIVRHHHEKFDGTGYPDGLKGDQIPLLVRIFSVLDTYEALIGVRPYKEPMEPELARKVLVNDSGPHFDPQIVDLFQSIFRN